MKHEVEYLELDEDQLHHALNKVWGQCSEHLRPALAMWHDQHRLVDVRAAIERGDAQLWPMGKAGTVVSEINDYPGQRVLNFWLAGGTLGALVSAEPAIAAWGRGEGCTAAQIIGRKGWRKVLPHYTHTADVLWRSLKLDG